MPPLNLQFVAPRQMTAATRAALAARAGGRSGEPMRLVTPSASGARALLRELARSGGGWGGVEALTLLDIARRRAALTCDLAALPPRADRLIVAHLLERQAGPLGERAQRPALATALARTIRTLREAGIVRLPPARDLVGDAAQQQRLAHLGVLLERFAAHLADRGLADDAEIYRRAGAASLREAPLVVCGVVQLSEVQRALVRALARETAVTWIIPDPHTPASGALAAAVALIDDHADFLRSLGFTPSAGDREDDAYPEARCVAAPGDAGEAREIARHVLAAAQRGVSFGEMAIVHAGDAAARRRLADELDRAGIPVAGAPERRLLDRPLGRALRALAKLVADDGSREAVIAVLTAQVAADGAAGVALARVAPLVRSAGCRQLDPASWRAALVVLAEQYTARARALQESEGADEAGGADGASAADGDRGAGGAGDPEKTGRGWQPSAADLTALADQARDLAERGATLLAQLAQFRRDVERGKDGWGGFANTWITLIHRVFGTSPLLRPAESAARELAGLDVLGVTPRLDLALEQWLDRLTVWSEREIAVGRGRSGSTAASADDAAAEGSSRPGRRAGEAVLVVELDDAVGVSARALWCAGLSQTAFDTLGAGDPWLQGGLRVALMERLECRIPLDHERLALREIAFAQLAGGQGDRSARSESVVLSWPRYAGTSGRIELPAGPLVRLIEARAGEALDPSTLAASLDIPGLDRPSGQLPTSDDPLRPLLTRAEYDVAAAALPAAERASRLAIDPRLARCRAADRARWRRTRLGAHDGVVGALWPDQTRFTVTQLQRLATCPFQFLLHDRLALRAALEPDDLGAPQQRDLGSLAHGVLQDVLAPLVGQPVPEDAALVGLVAQLAPLLRRRARGLAGPLSGGLPALWDAQIDAMRRDLTLFLLQELPQLRRDAATIVALEASYGPEPQPLEGGTIELEGRLDRVDRDAAGGWRLTDYKWSNGSAFTARETFAGGRHLQLALYDRLVTAAERVKPAGLRYAFLRPSGALGVGTKELTRSTLDAQQEKLDELLDNLVERAGAGTLFAVPDERRQCSACDFRGVCGPHKQVVARLKDGDERRVAHDRLAQDYP